MSHPDRSEDPRAASDPLAVSGAPAVVDPSEQSTRMAPPGAAAASAPQTWAHLQILEEVGHGAYGRVYRAWDPALAREVALKLTSIDTTDPAAAAEMLREGRMLARVRDKNVVTVYGARQEGKEIGLWMEFVRGRSLAHMIRDDGPLAAEEAAVIGINVCHALTAVHAAGLLHRDVKAQNVMRESGGRILLMDFGAGRDAASRERGWEEMAGTPLYMPPEVLAGKPWTQAGDVYSLGVLLFYLVTGRHPVEGRTLTEIVLAHGRGQQQLLLDCRPDLPEAFVRVVERALASMERRYKTAGALMRDLADAIPGISGSWREHLEASSVTGTVGGAGARTSPLNRVVAIAGGVAAVWLLGFLTTSAFDTPLGRTGAFNSEGALDWLVWGLRSLAGPALYMAMAVLVYRLVRVAWSVLLRLVPPLRRANDRTAALLRTRAATVGLDDRNTRAQWMLAAQVISLLVVVWLSYDLLSAVAGFASWADPRQLSLLRPESAAPVYYRFGLSILLLVSAVAWYRLLRYDAGAPPIDRTTAAAGIALIAILVMLLEIPFRVISLNQFERVNLSGERCYITGESTSRLLLFCPDRQPRIRIVGASDPVREEVAVQENLFTPAPPAR